MWQLGLTPLKEERFQIVLKHVRGKLLDIGCGKNEIVKRYIETGHEGIGVDVYDYGGDALIVESSADLPFDDGAFNTITFVANLNHITYQVEALKEAHRLLADQGTIVVTMINPFVGFFIHKIMALRKAGMDVERGIKEEEVYGLWKKDLVQIFSLAGLQCKSHRRFLYGLNNLYILEKQ